MMNPDRILHPSVPLYCRQSEKLQIMDLPTAEHSLDLAENMGLQRVPVWEICPEFQPIDRETALLYIPDRSWFAEEAHADSIHGQMHMWRVYFNVEVLGQMKKLNESEMRILRTAAPYHDLERINDIVDQFHGTRGAERYQKNFHLLEERGIKLSRRERKAAEALIRYHAIPYEKVPLYIKARYGNLLKIFMAADAGDRYRAHDPQWWPDERFAHGDRETKSLWRFDKYFTLMSEYIQTKILSSGPDAIAVVAVDLGILQDVPRNDVTVRRF